MKSGGKGLGLRRAQWVGRPGWLVPLGLMSGLG